MARIIEVIFFEGIEKLFFSSGSGRTEEIFWAGFARGGKDKLNLKPYSSELNKYVKNRRKSISGKIIKFFSSIFIIDSDFLHYKELKKFKQKFKVIIKEWTISDQEFFYNLEGSFEMVDKKDFAQSKILEEESRCQFITDYIKQVVEPFMSDYIWDFDNNKLFLYRKMGGKEEKRKKVIFDRDIKDQLEAIKFRRQGCEIKDINIKYAPDDESKKVEDKIENTVKPRKSPTLDEGTKSNLEDKAEDKAKDEKLYNAKGIKIKTILVDNGLRIEWKNQDQIKGSLKIYREEGNFSKDKYSSNGLLIADSELRRGEEGETIDYIEEEKDYYYTINYEPKRPNSPFEALNEAGGKGILDFFSRAVKLSEEIEETESGSFFLHICRFSIRLPKENIIEKKQLQPKTQVDRINERARLEKTIKETIAENCKKDLIEVDKRAEKERWSPEEVELKKDIIKAHWARIEMEELQKLERKFG